MLKLTEFAPIHTAIVTTAATVNAGDRRSTRAANPRSLIRDRH
jgi:hypothetical protein